MAARTAFDVELARRLIDRRRSTPGAALPILHDLQNQFGYIDDAAVPLLADALNISKAEVLGVVSFYHDFRRSPVDGRVLKMCRAESCQATGCEDLVAHLESRHGIVADDPEAERGSPRRDRLLSRQLRAFALRRCSTASRLAASIAARLDAIVAGAKGLGAVSARVFVPADSAALSVGADASGRRSGARGAAARHRALDRANRLARPFLAGAAGRSRDARKAASATGR